MPRLASLVKRARFRLNARAQAVRHHPGRDVGLTFLQARHVGSASLKDSMHWCVIVVVVTAFFSRFCASCVNPDLWKSRMNGERRLHQEVSQSPLARDDGPRDRSRQLLTLLVRNMHPENQPAVTEQVFCLLRRRRLIQIIGKMPSAAPSASSGNARHCDLQRRSAPLAAKANRRAASRGKRVERTGDQGALGKIQRTLSTGTARGTSGSIRHLDDSSEFVTDYSFDHFPVMA